MIEIMKESTDRMLAVRATGYLTDSDYTEIWIPALQAIIDEYEFANALLFLDEDFKGWEAKALWEDAKFGMKHRSDFARIAVVGGPQWIQWGIKLGEMFIDGAIRTYEPSELTTALAWAAETPHCACDT